MRTIPEFSAEVSLQSSRTYRDSLRASRHQADWLALQQDGDAEALAPPTVCTCPCCQVYPCWGGFWTCMTCC